MRGARLQRKEVFVPLVHPPGDPQVDFGEALVVVGGAEHAKREPAQNETGFMAGITLKYVLGETRAFLAPAPIVFGEVFGDARVVGRLLLADHHTVAHVDVPTAGAGMH